MKGGRKVGCWSTDCTVVMEVIAKAVSRSVRKKVPFKIFVGQNNALVD